MAYVFLALFLFALSVMTHILFCRGTTQKGLQAKACILIATFFLIIYVLLAYSSLMEGNLDPNSWWGLPVKISAGLIFILLVPVYLCFYVLTQLVSPSKKILLCISTQGAMSYADIISSVSQEDFINTRLRDLVDSGCVRLSDGRYRLSLSGRKLAGFLDMMQGVLGREIGG